VGWDVGSVRTERILSGRVTVQTPGPGAPRTGRMCQSGHVTDVPPTPAPTAGAPHDEEPQCSAKGCRAAAVWALRWNNPKIHTPERRKIWLACDAHREHLSAFLDRRGFLRDVVPLSELDEPA